MAQKLYVPPDGLILNEPDIGDTYITGVGQTIREVHDVEKCVGHSCVVHDPSNHSMRGFRTLWRGDRRIMERVCPHGVGHPDPDDMAFQNRAFGDAADSGVHGCDGCCA